MLWLVWFVAFLDGASAFAPITKQVEEIGHRWLDRIERIVMAIVMLCAVRHVRRVTPPRGVAQLHRNDSALARAVVGSALRRALRSRDLRQRIARLGQDLDTLIARLLRRLPRGLTRRRRIKPRRKPIAIILAVETQCWAYAADTS